MSKVIKKDDPRVVALSDLFQRALDIEENAENTTDIGLGGRRRTWQSIVDRHDRKERQQGVEIETDCGCFDGGEG